MNNFNFKLSLPGYDAKTATPEQCIIHSDYPVFKFKPSMTDTVTKTFTTNATTSGWQNYNVLTINHEYNFIPAAIGLIKVSGNPAGSDIWFTLPFSYTVSQTFGIKTDKDNMNIYFTFFYEGSNPTLTVTIKYYIFAHSGG